MPKSYQGLLLFLIEVIYLITPKVPLRVASTQPKDTPSRVFLRCASALVCIRASLHTLNQMVYQAILQEKPLAFNDSNIITYNGPSSMLGEEQLSIVSQPDQARLPATLAIWFLLIVRS